MKQVHIALLRALAMALLTPILLVMSSVVVAQEVDRPCAEAAALAESLLPADAEYAGSFARGTAIWSQQPASLWRSASLAERFADMGEDRGGEILILYTYQQNGIEPGPIERVELRTLELSE